MVLERTQLPEPTPTASATTTEAKQIARLSPRGGGKRHVRSTAGGALAPAPGLPPPHAAPPGARLSAPCTRGGATRGRGAARGCSANSGRPSGAAAVHAPLAARPARARPDPQGVAEFRCRWLERVLGVSYLQRAPLRSTRGVGQTVPKSGGLGRPELDVIGASTCGFGSPPQAEP